MTLPELITTLTIAMILSLAAFALIDVTIRRTSEIDARVDSVQRGRMTMDLMTRQLRSQVCLGGASARSITAGTGTSIEFYVDMGDPSTKAGFVTAPTRVVERRKLSLEANGAILETRWVGTPTTSGTLGFSFFSTPTATRELIKPAAMVAPTNPLHTTPALFRYYAYDTAKPSPEPDKLLVPGASGLTDAQLRAIAKVEIAFRAMPTRPRPDGRASSVFLNDVSLRTVDPNADLTELNSPCL